MRDIIQNFLNTERESIPLQFYPIDTYTNILKDFGYEMEDLEDNLNGFSVDFWYYYKNKEGNRLCLGGSLWYGDFALSKVEEDE